MNTVFVKLRLNGNASKYRKMLSTEEPLFNSIAELVVSSSDYSVATLLEDGEWFKITEMSQKAYAIDLVQQKFETVDFNSLSKDDFSKIDFIFVKNNNEIFFQKLTKAKLATKKSIMFLGEAYEYKSDSEAIVINNIPDAIYCCETDILYFRKLEPIVGIFKGISELYIEATDEETEQFLQNDFIELRNGYGSVNVKTANRKRIALAKETLSNLNEEEKRNIFNYIGEYCPDLKTENNTFSVGNEEELKMVLYGIEQRFYTTLVGSEKRIANSVVLMSS